MYGQGHGRQLKLGTEAVHMSQITIELTDGRMQQLRDLAQAMQLAPEDLLRLSVEDLLGQPAEDLQSAIAQVLAKNRELYKRLS